jgi:hypothetical protein
LCRDKIFPVAAECILGHEFGHSAIIDMPNYVHWFDDGLADILGFANFATYHGKVDDLKIWMNYRNELKQYGQWYAEYDKLVAAIILSCGLDFVKALVKLKQNESRKVDWTKLANVLRAIRPTKT